MNAGVGKKSQILSSVQYIWFRKTSVSNIGAPNLLLAPDAIYLVTPLLDRAHKNQLLKGPASNANSSISKIRMKIAFGRIGSPYLRGKFITSKQCFSIFLSHATSQFAKKISWSSIIHFVTALKIERRNNFFQNITKHPQKAMSYSWGVRQTSRNTALKSIAVASFRNTFIFHRGEGCKRGWEPLV